MARTIQSNIKRNTKDFSQYSMFLGGLDVSAKNIEQFDPLRTGYSRIFIVKLPFFMTKLASANAENNETALHTRFKHFIEMGFIGVSGIGNTTMEYEAVTGGYAGNKFDIPSVCRDETDGVTIRVYELTGSPIREFIDTWMTGISDPLTGLSHYHGMIGQDCPFSAKNHIMEMFYVATDPTGVNIEYACMLSNMMPKTVAKQHFEYEPGNHPAVQLDLDFTATRYESPQINEISSALLDKYAIIRDYLDFTSGYTANGGNITNDKNENIAATIGTFYSKNSYTPGNTEYQQGPGYRQPTDVARYNYNSANM